MPSPSTDVVTSYMESLTFDTESTVPEAVLLEDTSKSDASTFDTPSSNVTRNTSTVLPVCSAIGSDLVNDTIVGDMVSTVYDSFVVGGVLISTLGMSALSTILLSDAISRLSMPSLVTDMVTLYMEGLI